MSKLDAASSEHQSQISGKANAKTRPGFMLYLELRRTFELLSENQRGILIMDIFDYVETGALPEYSNDTTLAVVWSLVQPKLDYDNDRYTNKVLQSQYAVFCREAHRRNEVPCSFDEWKNSGTTTSLDESTDIGRYPTASAIATTTASTAAESPRATSSLSPSLSVGMGKFEGENQELPVQDSYGGYTPLSVEEFEQSRATCLAMLEAKGAHYRA